MLFSQCLTNTLTSAVWVLGNIESDLSNGMFRLWLFGVREVFQIWKVQSERGLQRTS